MRRTTKRILMISLVFLDLVFGTILVINEFGSNEHEKIVLVKAAGNFVPLEKSFRINKEVVDNTEVQIAEQKRLKKAEEERIAREKAIVYDGLTLKQLGAKLDRSLNSTLSGKGELIASYALKKGVDPYLATAIILHETGCQWGCSNLVRNCNNVGGQKGSGCGAYAKFPDLDTGIKKFIDNLYKNYYAYGLNTPEKMQKKYACSTTWAGKVNNYIKKIKSR